MDARNPYAPTQASLQRGITSGQAHSSAVWRDGGVLVMEQGAPMPNRCVKCNAPAELPTDERKLYWHHPGIYALILINLLIYLIVALIVRKSAIVSPGMCVEHRKRRRNAILVGWLVALGGIVLFFAAAASGDSDTSLSLVGIGILLLLAGMLWGIVLGRVVYAKRIDAAYVRLKGCGVPFLDSLPPFDR